MRVHVVVSPMRHRAVRARVQVPSATGGWVTLGNLHGTRQQMMQLYLQLQKGARDPSEVSLVGRWEHPPAASSAMLRLTPRATGTRTGPASPRHR